MEDEAKDVNQTDGTTDTTTSDSEQTPVVTDDTSTQNTEDNATATQDVKTVPYDRFAEVNEKFRSTELQKAQLEAKLEMLEKMQTAGNAAKAEPHVTPEIAAAKEQLKNLLKEVAPDLGFVSQDELRRRDAEANFKAEVQTLKEKYNGKDGRPAFDDKEALDYAVKNNITLERAYKEMHESELINWHVQQAINKSKGITTENSNSTGSQNVGTTDQDLMTAAARGDREAQKIFAKRILQGSRK